VLDDNTIEVHTLDVVSTLGPREAVITVQIGECAFTTTSLMFTFFLPTVASNSLCFGPGLLSDGESNNQTRFSIVARNALKKNRKSGMDKWYIHIVYVDDDEESIAAAGGMGGAGTGPPTARGGKAGFSSSRSKTSAMTKDLDKGTDTLSGLDIDLDIGGKRKRGDEDEVALHPLGANNNTAGTKTDLEWNVEKYGMRPHAGGGGGPPGKPQGSQGVLQGSRLGGNLSLLIHDMGSKFFIHV
jgi:hypothetical protein